MPPRKRPGVFCLETPWSASLTDRASVRPLLDMLERCDIATYAYRDASTVEEFEVSLRQWTQKQYANLGLGYIACHGDPGSIRVGRTSYELGRLGDCGCERLGFRAVWATGSVGFG